MVGTEHAEAPPIKEPRSVSGILGQDANNKEACGYCGLPMLGEMPDRPCWSKESFQKEADCEAGQQGLRYSSGRQGRAMNKRQETSLHWSFLVYLSPVHAERQLHAVSEWRRITKAAGAKQLE